MEQIEVGEYVRTKYDGILKIRDIKEEEVFNTYYAMGRSYSYSEKRKFIYYRDDDKRISIDDIVKHSFNIIDLIEVGDYVNGHLVVEISENIQIKPLVVTEVDGKDGAVRHFYAEKSIKSIVTHEQFASMQYRLED